MRAFFIAFPVYEWVFFTGSIFTGTTTFHSSFSSINHTLMSRLHSWYIARNTTSRSIIIFATTLALAALLFLTASIQMKIEGRKAMHPYVQSQVVINRYFDSLPRPGQLNDRYFTIFKTQQKILDLRKTHHLDLGIIFFRNYYGVLILLMIFSCIGGVVLFLIANQGWTNASLELKALFLALSLLVTFCGFFPAVFKQQENFNENLNYYMRYTKAEMDIADQLSRLNNPYFATAIDSLTQSRYTDSVLYFRQIDSMITVNKNTINTLTSFVLNIEAKEISNMADVSKMLQGNTQPAAPESH